MLECLVDSREQALLDDLQQKPLSITTCSQMLPLGDVIIQKQEGNEVLMMIERKTVRDLIQSLRDGRYHDQRKRWLEFRLQSPLSFISLWIEGDLMATDMDDGLRSSLLNSLFRLQSKHQVLVHHVRSREAFVKSLRMVVEKFDKDPYHLRPTDSELLPTTLNLDMKQYRKSAHSQEEYWQDCLCLIPGVSSQTTQKIRTLFPSLMSLVESLHNDPRATMKAISQIPLSEKRKLGEKLAQKILCHIDPTLSFLDERRKEKKKIISL